MLHCVSEKNLANLGAIYLRDENNYFWKTEST